MKVNCAVRLMIVLTVIQMNDTYDILVLIPHPSKSHFFVFVRLFKALAERGHNLTVISYFPATNTSNYKNIQIGDLNEFSDVIAPFSVFNELENTRTAKYSTPLVLATIGNKACVKFFESNSVKEVLDTSKNFDLVLMEEFWTECLWCAIRRFKSSVVYLKSSTLSPWSGRKLGNYMNPSHSPNIYLPHSDRMSFLQRLENALLHFANIFYYDYIFMHVQAKLTKKYCATTYDITLDIESLLLINTHLTLNLPKVLPPNIVDVGGIHIEASAKISEVRSFLEYDGVGKNLQIETC